MKSKAPVFIILLTAAIFAGCTNSKLKEYVVYRTNYTYTDNSTDSSTVIIEHSFFNRDSIKTNYISEKTGYFYVADIDRKKGSIKKMFYALDSSFNYYSVSSLDRENRETRIEFLDSASVVTYAMNFEFLDNTSKVIKQVNVFQDSSQQETFTTYDQYGNLKDKIRISTSDTTLLESHKMNYDNEGRIVLDTAYYPEGRKIIFNEYREGFLFFKTEEFEVLSADGTEYLPLGNSYWKKYYVFNDQRQLIEIRNIRMHRYSETFGLDSRLVMEYKNDLKVKETLINKSDQKVYSIDMNYIF